MTDRAEFDATYRLQREHRVTFAEIDMLQHVNNAVYVTWAETLRCTYVADVLGTAIGGREGIIMAKHELIYEAPVPYRDTVAIGQRVAKLGTRSIVFETAVWSVGLARRVFRADAICVAFDYTAGSSISVPPSWRERVAAYEPVPPAN